MGRLRGRDGAVLDELLENDTSGLPMGTAKKVPGAATGDAIAGEAARREANRSAWRATCMTMSRAPLWS